MSQARGWVTEGFTYTSADLIEDLGPDRAEALDRTLEITSDAARSSCAATIHPRLVPTWSTRG